VGSNPTSTATTSTATGQARGPGQRCVTARPGPAAAQTRASAKDGHSWAAGRKGRNVRQMTAVVEAAWIGAIIGGIGIISTATVAIVGARTTRKVTDRTNKAGTANIVLALDAARAGLLWEKRADAYIDALRFLHRRQALRQEALRAARFDQQGEELIRQWLNSVNMPDEWQAVEMRVLAYGSQPVLDALREAGQANDAIGAARQKWEDAREQVSAAATLERAASDVRVAYDAIKSAIEHADGKDEELLAAIRADLHDRTSMALLAQDGLPTIARTPRRWPGRHANPAKRTVNGAKMARTLTLPRSPA
jgi:hypothetical protein